MFQKYKSYIHKNMLDCVIVVQNSFRLPDGRYKLKIHWFNRRGLDLGIRENVVINREQIPNWYEWKGREV